MNDEELEELGIDSTFSMSCNLPGFVRQPVEGMNAVAEVAGRMIRDTFEDYVCDPFIPLNTETVFRCLVEIRFDKHDGGISIDE